MGTGGMIFFGHGLISTRNREALDDRETRKSNGASGAARLDADKLLSVLRCGLLALWVCSERP